MKAYVYIMSNFARTVTYIGVTKDLEQRLVQHRNRTGSEFVSRYSLFYLMYFEEWNSISDAIAREKQLKNWHSDWKWNQIKLMNPDLRDLSNEIY